MARVKAFTLLEVTVALLLTGILAVLAYGMIGVFHTVALRAHAAGGELQQVRDLQHALVADADRSTRLLRTADGFAFHAAGEVARYARSEAGVLRTAAARVDTFHIALVRLEGYWNGRRVAGAGAPVEQLVLTTLAAGDSVHIAFTQPYDEVTRRTFD